ncbi:MAG: hypothetical protein O2983_04110 [Planctomycetota bacterium]|nr:hypothetical protein [Planctomycetota bacterium]MDA0920778.1 hypothetical protein [Planctomycetota bacterium]MDA1158773.1 hypothetical protein [Planctomycetota bacterium]
MSDQASLQILNDLLNRVRYSLLQYIGESWPWTDKDEQARNDSFMGLVRRQQFSAERLASFLLDRRAVVSGSNYPKDCSELHFVTLDFAKKRLVENGTEVVAAFKDSASQLSDDPEALRLIEQLASDEAQTLEILKSL